MFFDGRCSHNNYHDFILLPTRIILHCSKFIFLLDGKLETHQLGLLFVMVSGVSHVALLLFKCITTTNVMGMYNIGQPFHSALYSFCISSSIKQHYSLNQKLGMMWNPCNCFASLEFVILFLIHKDKIILFKNHFVVSFSPRIHMSSNQSVRSHDG